MDVATTQEETESNPAATDNITDAYERGKRDKSHGHQRKALPPEYRGEAHMREAVAWQAGFDGAAMPAFQSAETK